MADMNIYSVDEIIGKSLYSLKQLIGRTSPDDLSIVSKVFAPSVIVGTVYSYIMVGSDMWWMFYPNNKLTEKPYYIKHEKGAFSLEFIKEQGGKTVKEKTEEKAQENLTAWEKLLLSLKTGANYLIIFLVIAIVIYVLLKTGILNEKKK